MAELTLVQYIQYMVLPYVGLFSIIFVPMLFYVLWRKLLPEAARIMFWAKRRNKSLLLIVHDSGRGEFTLISERRGSGVVMTDGGKYKMLPRYVSKHLTPTNPGSDLSNPSNEDGTVKAVKTVQYEKVYTDYINKRCILKGLNLPFYVGYSGKLNLLNPEALALYEMGEMKVPTTEGMLFNPKNVPGKNIADALQPLQLVDARVIKELFSKSFDETQIAAIVADAELLGLMGRGFGRFLPWLMILGIIALAIVGLLVLPDLLG